jgi:hypothetical protein
MPIQWKISHPDRMVLIECSGVVTRSDFEAYLDAIVVDDVMPYRKLFECQNATSGLVDGDMMALGARIQAYVQAMPDGMGPLAIVAKTEAEEEYARIFAALAVGRRRIRIFPNTSIARAWLDSFDIQQ